MGDVLGGRSVAEDETVILSDGVLLVGQKVCWNDQDRHETAWLVSPFVEDKGHSEPLQSAASRRRRD